MNPRSAAAKLSCPRRRRCCFKNGEWRRQCYLYERNACIERGHLRIPDNTVTNPYFLNGRSLRLKLHRIHYGFIAAFAKGLERLGHNLRASEGAPGVSRSVPRRLHAPGPPQAWHET